jgi:hypothetical protein
VVGGPEPTWRAGVEIAALDPAAPYRAALVDPEVGLPGAQLVLDRFHAEKVRREAPCIRGRVRDPPLRPVAAGR